jgi:hypothetical protein
MGRHKTLPPHGRAAKETGMNTRGSDFWDQPSAPQIGPEQFSEIVTTAADLAIVLDTEGTVKSVITNPLNPTLGRLDHWKDRDIREFMAEDSLTKLETHLRPIARARRPRSMRSRSTITTTRIGNSRSATRSTRPAIPTSS